MSRIILLDSGPLGLATRRPGIPIADQCRAWLAALEMGGAEILVPEIADYEVRHELLRVGIGAGIRRLDDFQIQFSYLPLTTEAMRRAAEFWASMRKTGVPTADPHALDADAILAGQAATVGQPGDTVTVATTNLRHLARFPGIDAQLWTAIV